MLIQEDTNLLLIQASVQLQIKHRDDINHSIRTLVAGILTPLSKHIRGYTPATASLRDLRSPCEWERTTALQRGLVGNKSTVSSFVKGPLPHHQYKTFPYT